MNSIDESQEAAQQRATALSQELSALIEASPVGIVRFRNDRTVSSWSAAAERMLGWKAEEIIGKPLPLAPDSSHDWSELVGRLAAGASWSYRNQAGEAGWLHHGCSGIRGANP